MFKNVTMSKKVKKVIKKIPAYSQPLHLSPPRAGRRAADGHAGHVRQPVHAAGLGHRVRPEHHDKLHAGKRYHDPARL